MLKKIPIPVLVTAMVLQIIAPVAMMIYSSGLDKRTLEKGKEYKFIVSLLYVSCDEDGKNKLYFTADSNYPYLRDKDGLFNSGFGTTYSDSYVSIRPVENGFYVTEMAPLGKGRPEEFVYKNRPDKFPYCGFAEVDFYYSGSFFGREAPKEAYAVVKIYKGNAVVTALYADGLPINDWLENKITASDNEIEFSESIDIPMDEYEVSPENEYLVNLDDYTEPLF